METFGIVCATLSLLFLPLGLFIAWRYNLTKNSVYCFFILIFILPLTLIFSFGIWIGMFFGYGSNYLFYKQKKKGANSL
jgi:hypothetical protein